MSWGQSWGEGGSCLSAEIDQTDAQLVWVGSLSHAEALLFIVGLIFAILTVPKDAN